jgi:hypothetical protein
MKTHDLAKALRALASLLEKSRNIPIEELRVASRDTTNQDSTQIALSLSTLVELSRVDKQQWLAFINDLGFPIDVRPRDASRDLLGKLLAYLEANESARERLKTKAASKESQASPELMKALSSLLKDST